MAEEKPAFKISILASGSSGNSLYIESEKKRLLVDAGLSGKKITSLMAQIDRTPGANFQFFQTFTIVGIIYLVMTFTITRILRAVEKKIDGPSAYTKLEEIDNSNLQE